MHDFRRLEVWKKSKNFTVEIYKQTQSFPKEEIYGLTSQLRRAAMSIGNNIAEGCGRGSDQQLSHFLNIAIGSAYEVENILIIAFEISYLSQKNYDNLYLKINEIEKMLFGFKKFLN